MGSSEIVRDALLARNLSATAPIISSPSDDGTIFIPLKITRDISGRQIPNHKTLSEIREELGRHGIKAEFFLIDENARMMEDGLRGSLISSFPDLVRNSFSTVDAGNAKVWIETKRGADQGDAQKVNEHVRHFLLLYGLRGFSVYFSSETNHATNSELLSIIRNLAPVSCEMLRDGLLKRDFHVPSLEWINHKFDALRKTGFLVRLSDRSYVLTSKALNQLGTRKNRYSPDITRLLALARRGR